jgi:phage terminase large subunit-like protein
VGFSVRDLLRQAAERPDLLEDPEFREVYDQLAGTVEKNPLLAFEAHSDAQRDFIAATTPIVAAFAGNRFGKSTVLAVCALREALDEDMLPPVLRGSKRFSGPTAGWVVCPSEAKIFDAGGFQSVFEKWTPKEAFKGGSWGKAFNGARLTLSFKNGSSISFKTYQQDPSTLGGAALHWVGFDEPPPRKHREECMTRLADYGGYEMFAMTPLESNTGYVRREIYKKRESPEITVVRGSIHDNPTLHKATVERLVRSWTDIWAQARELGDFVDMGGLIYPEFGRCVLAERPTVDEIRGQDIVVGIDNGIRNAGIIFTAFDGDNSCTIFDELLLQDSTPDQYAKGIRQTLARWGISERDVHFVIDPSARSRGQVNADTVMAALAREGIYCNAGQNDVQAGIGQGRIRMAHGRLKVSPECRGLRDEADDYAAEEPAEGKDDSHLTPVKSNDHRLDAARYAWMERFWDPVMEQDAPNRNLGWTPDVAPNLTSFPSAQPEVGAMGSMG